MSRVTQSRQQTEANAKLLRSLVKSPDNKVCVDCKKNDPRWAAWNLGCFLCIRCSGIHRSMGTHISKVKSIDLDIWTPEQMESVQKWGNRRCNLYWEAHLKAGHVPADHKIESFIRSKYESRRWAKDGPLPPDPSILDGGEAAPAVASASKPAEPAAVKKAAAKVDLFDDEPAPAPAPAIRTQPPTAATSAATAPAPATTAAKPSGGGIFDLDWHEPSPTSSNTATSPTAITGAKGKNDIMSLFAAKPNPPPVPASSGGGGGFGDFIYTAPTSSTQQSSSGFGDFAYTAPSSASTQASGVSGLNSSFGDLDLTSSASQAKPANPPGYTPSAGGNPWSSNPTTTPAGGGSAGGGLFDTHDVWGSSGVTTAGTATATKPKDDAFADIWGDFK